MLARPERATGATVPVAELRNASLAFGSKVILANFSLAIPAGRKISVVGESSSGKSSLLKVLIGLIPPDRGELYLFGRDFRKIHLRDREKIRRRVGTQFQAGALFDSMNVRENLSLAKYESSRGRQKVDPRSLSGEIQDLLSAVGLGKAGLLNPASLSGGMRKRAAIARALIGNPELAVFDEPTAGLDPLTSGAIIHLLNSLSRDSGAAMVLATSDVDIARRFSEDIVIFHQGRIWARGSLDEHLASPDPYIQRFLARHKRLRAR
ncbi:MAG: ATP-binding cassette domain-containing protein [Deltaproteobacteria bacterium]|nr:ATP-binding cassette domain-containing protein [Deltaproteobacteria bacterium]